MAIEDAFPLRLTIGPYKLVVLHAERGAMPLRRKLMHFELSQGLAWLHESLSGKRLAEQFLNLVLRVTQKAAGCSTGANEEAFTQVLAAGLVAFAQNNPEAWLWFNQLLAQSVKPGARFVQVLRGSSRRTLRVPKLALIDKHVIRYVPLSHKSAVRAAVDGFYGPHSNIVELYEGLHGPNRAVVFLHETTHAIHQHARLKVRDTRGRFIAAEVTGWLRFIQQNPGAWMWLLATIREQSDFEPLEHAA
jgi:hypothetical protein